jgi:hypothetical protein
MLVGKNLDRPSLSTALERWSSLGATKFSVRSSVACLLSVILASLALTACGGGDNTTSFVVQSASASPSPSTSASASAASSASPGLPQTEIGATPIAGGGRIIIDSPDAGSAISSPVVVTGTASVDNGTVVAVVLDAAGKELGRASTTAGASKPNFGHFDASVDYSGAIPGAKGQVKVFGVSPRDGKTPTNYYFVTVRFS